MRNYTRIDKYLDELLSDLYPQPPDPQHLCWMLWTIRRFMKMFPECKSVLDVGCGEAHAQNYFNVYGADYFGICLGKDWENARKRNRHVSQIDFNFIPLAERYDLIFARHALEHSPIPLLTLMEWHRVSNRWLCLVVPNPDYWTYYGRNHYFVLNKQQMRWILRRSGWKIVWKQYNKYEYRYFCEKHPRISYEGWATAPLDAKIYESERDNP